MGMLFKLAFRNAFRYKRRTVITFAAVSLGLAFLIVGISLLNGFDKHAMVNMIDSQIGHLKIHQKGYFDKRDDLPMNLLIRDPGRIRDLVAAVPGVRGAESRILFACGLIKGMDELPCLGVAVDPGLDPDIFNIAQSLREGRWLEPGDHKLLIGKDLARDVDLRVGDTVTLRMITSQGNDDGDDGDFTWNALDLEVKGIFNTGNPLVDNQQIIVPIGLAREGLALGGAATEIVLRLKSHKEKKLLEAKRAIRDILTTRAPGLEIVTWQQLAGVFLELNKGKKRRSAGVIMIMLFIASLGIVNTMMMAVFERTREIGMLAAMGMTKKQIIRLFLLEGGIIGLLGAVLGCILGGLGGWYLAVRGWDISGMGETFRDIVSSTFPIKDVMYGDLSPDLLVATFILGTLVSVLASLYPAYKAVKMNPVEALRHI